MTIPVWVLLIFALWTLLTLIVSVGIYRLKNIFLKKTSIQNYSFPDLDQSEWHRRATRAHLNCLENLPVYGAMVLVIVATKTYSPTLDLLAIILIAARVIHTVIHLGFKQTGKITSIRFLFFAIQIFCMVYMGGWLLWNVTF